MADDNLTKATAAVQANPKDPEAWLKLGQLLQDRGQADKAGHCFRQAQKLTSKPPPTSQQATRPTDDELGRATAAVKANAKDPEAWLKLGKLLQARGQVDKANHCRRQAQALTPTPPSPTSPDITRQEAVSTETPDAASPQPIVSPSKPPETARSKVFPPETVSQKPPQISAQHPGAPAPQSPQATSASLPLSPQEAAHKKAAQAAQYFRKGNLVQAQRLFEESLALWPEFAEAHNVLGQCFQQRGQLEQAVAQWEEGLRYDPNHSKMGQNLTSGLYRQGLELMRAGQGAAALPILERALTLYRNSPPDRQDPQMLIQVEKMVNAARVLAMTSQTTSPSTKTSSPPMPLTPAKPIPEPTPQTPTPVTRAPVVAIDNNNDLPGLTRAIVSVPSSALTLAAGAQLPETITTNRNIYLKTVCNKLRQDNFTLTKDKLDGYEVIIATKKEFMLKWLSQVHIFVIIGFSNHVSKESIEDFSRISYEYAIKNYQGLPRGFSSLIFSFALLVSPNIDEHTKQWVQKFRKDRLFAIEKPIIFNLTDGQVYYCKDKSLWGLFYHGFAANSIEKYFKFETYETGALTSDLPPSTVEVVTDFASAPITPPTKPITSTKSVNNASAVDPDVAFYIEFMGAMFGFLGAGYLYSGRFIEGAIRLLIWWTYIAVSFVVIFIPTFFLSFFAGIGLCIPVICAPLQLAFHFGVTFWSANALRNSLTRQQHG